MTELGVRRPSRSPATKPGFRKGRTPDNAGRKWPAEILTPEEALVLIAGCSRTSSLGLRNRAIIGVLYRSGLRISECLALYPKDIDLERGEITVLHGKGDKRGVSTLDEGGCRLVVEWLERRAELGLTDDYPLFSTLHGTLINPAYVRTLLPRLAKEAGIRKRVHPHGLRHTHAVELLREGVDIDVIQQQLRHTDLATTVKYLRHLAPGEAVKVIRAREWSP